MDLTGKIIAIMPAREGTSNRTGNKWKSQDYVIEWFEGQYPRHCIFNVYGEDRIAQMNLQMGQEYTISVDIDAHEFNGRWFNDIRAWRAMPPQANQTVPPTEPQSSTQQETPAPPTADQVPAPADKEGVEDDLPF